MRCYWWRHGCAEAPAKRRGSHHRQASSVGELSPTQLRLPKPSQQTREPSPPDQAAWVNRHRPRLVEGLAGTFMANGVCVGFKEEH